MPGKYVTAVFKLHCLPKSLRIKEGFQNYYDPRTCILGSIAELGKWNLEKHVKASPSWTYTEWEARILIPAGSTFEWSWVVMDNKCTKILFWDPCKRNTSLSTIGGTIHVAWGHATQAFRSYSCAMEVSVDYHCTHGQYLVLTGGEPALGNWDPRMGVEAREEHPSGSGRWTANLVVERMQTIEWKWVVVEGPDRKVIRWQDSNNHKLFIEDGLDCIEVEATWDGLCVVLSHNARLRPHYWLEEENARILEIMENLEVMEESNGRKMEEKNQPRRRTDKQNKKNKSSKSSVTRKQKFCLSNTEEESVDGQTTSTTSETQEADDTFERSGFSLFRRIFRTVTTY